MKTFYSTFIGKITQPTHSQCLCWRLFHHDCLPQSTKQRSTNQNCYVSISLWRNGKGFILQRAVLQLFWSLCLLYEHSSAVKVASESGSAVNLCLLLCMQLYCVSIQTLSTVWGHRNQQRASWDWDVTLICVQKTRMRSENDSRTWNEPKGFSGMLWIY